MINPVGITLTRAAKVSIAAFGVTDMGGGVLYSTGPVSLLALVTLSLQSKLNIS
jgi:hypothetical protein